MASARVLSTGIGLRAQHHEEIISSRPAVGWFEAHSENYFGPGGAHRECLLRIRAHYPLSLHGVGLSIGSIDPLDPYHLRQLQRLVNDVEPIFVSEHLSWGSAGGRHLNDLLPLPYTEEALRHMAARVREVQDALGRQILMENISSYLRFVCPEVPEWEFLTALAEESGCGILLDVNNIYVNAMNHGFDPHPDRPVVGAEVAGPGVVGDGLHPLAQRGVGPAPALVEYPLIRHGREQTVEVPEGGRPLPARLEALGLAPVPGGRVLRL